jgi:hypothetical protein
MTKLIPLAQAGPVRRTLAVLSFTTLAWAIASMAMVLIKPPGIADATSVLAPGMFGVGALAAVAAAKRFGLAGVIDVLAKEAARLAGVFTLATLAMPGALAAGKVPFVAYLGLLAVVLAVEGIKSVRRCWEPLQRELLDYLRQQAADVAGVDLPHLPGEEDGSAV